MVCINLSVDFHDILLVQALRPIPVKTTMCPNCCRNSDLMVSDNGAAHVMPHVKSTPSVSSDEKLLLGRLSGPARLQKGRLNDSECTLGGLGRNKRREQGVNRVLCMCLSHSSWSGSCLGENRFRGPGWFPPQFPLFRHLNAS